jgi:anti-anti-sigma regulatory factor
LAAIVLNSVIPLVAFGEAKHLLRVKRHDFVLWVVAFIGTLFLGVLMGILVAVSLSLVIVIYESVRPQITILWRIPGTTIYRNMKQESSGSFIPNVFICRIGCSMYFANAQFVKEMLMAYIMDLEDVNPTEYLVLEMTPVVSIDSTACHVIHDIVADFRSRGIEVAFAMVGNRVDKTMRKAKLKKYIGEKWFFPTVNEAVQFCLRHQHAKKTLQETSPTAAGGLDMTMINVGFSNEIGFSNDMHAEDTMVFITLSQDVPMIMSEITAIFKKSQLTIIRAQIEPLADDGAKHTYFLRSIKTGTKLSEKEIDRVREDLEVLVKRHDSISIPGSPINSNTMAQREKDLDSAGNGMHDTQLKRLAALEARLQAMEEEPQVVAPKEPTPWQRASKKFCCYWIP